MPTCLSGSGRATLGYMGNVDRAAQVYGRETWRYSRARPHGLRESLLADQRAADSVPADRRAGAVLKQLHADGRIAGLLDFGSKPWADFVSVVRMRDELVHASTMGGSRSVKRSRKRSQLSIVPRREDPGRERGRQLPRHAVHLQPRGRAAAPGQARGEDQPGGIAAGPLFASGSRMPPWPPKSGAPEATAARRTSRTLMRLPRAALFLLPRVLRWDDSSLPGRERCRPFAAGSARTAARSPARDTTAPAGPSRAAHLQRQLSGLRQRAVDRSPHWDSAFVRRGLP